MNYHVVFSPEAEEQLVGLYHYIAAAASPNIAARYTEAIVSYCDSLVPFPIAVLDATTYGLACVLLITKSAP